MSYADLVTNLLLFFVTLVGASQISTLSKQRIASSFNGGKSSSSSLIALDKELRTGIEEAGLDEVFSVEMRKDGLTLSFDSGVLFNLGESEIQSQWETSLKKMIDVILPYRDQYSFAIEGHTDPIPVKRNSSFSSNWELGFARAENIRNRLERSGIDGRKMRVESYADTMPLAESNNEKQRRVVVRLF